MALLMIYSLTILAIKESYIEWFIILSASKNCSPSMYPEVVRKLTFIWMDAA